MPPPPSARPAPTPPQGTASLILAIVGVVLGIPLGVPGLVLGATAYFLGKAAVRKIEASADTLGGRSTATTGWVVGVVATAIGAVVTFLWFLLFLLSVSSPPATGV
jgi:hypothetical protein